MTRNAGFITVTADAYHPERLIVRARRRADLEGLASMPVKSPPLIQFCPAPVDYAWWLTITRMDLVLFLNREVATLDYTGLPTNGIAGDDLPLLAALIDASMALADLHSEEGAPVLAARRVRHNRSRRSRA
jgi:hypothetical protein